MKHQRTGCNQKILLSPDLQVHREGKMILRLRESMNCSGGCTTIREYISACKRQKACHHHLKEEVQFNQPQVAKLSSLCPRMLRICSIKDLFSAALSCLGIPCALDQPSGGQNYVVAMILSSHPCCNGQHMAHPSFRVDRERIEIYAKDGSCKSIPDY